MPKKTLISIRINDLTERQISELLDKFSMTQTDLVCTAIERLYQQEIGAADTTNERGTNMKKLTYYVATNEDYYGNEDYTTDEIERWSQAIADHAQQYMAEEYPEVEFSVEFVPETTSRGTWTDHDGNTAESEEIMQGLENYVANNWVDWCEETANEKEQP